ncbi:uncharacterized protein RHO17_004591 [Thomomys bottae]
MQYIQETVPEEQLLGTADKHDKVAGVPREVGWSDAEREGRGLSLGSTPWVGERRCAGPARPLAAAVCTARSRRPFLFQPGELGAGDPEPAAFLIQGVVQRAEPGFPGPPGTRTLLPEVLAGGAPSGAPSTPTGAQFHRSGLDPDSSGRSGPGTSAFGAGAGQTRDVGALSMSRADPGRWRSKHSQGRPGLWRSEHAQGAGTRGRSSRGGAAGVELGGPAQWRVGAGPPSAAGKAAPLPSPGFSAAGKDGSTPEPAVLLPAWSPARASWAAAGSPGPSRWCFHPLRSQLAADTTWSPVGPLRSRDALLQSRSQHCGGVRAPVKPPDLLTTRVPSADGQGWTWSR